MPNNKAKVRRQHSPLLLLNTKNLLNCRAECFALVSTLHSATCWRKGLNAGSALTVHPHHNSFFRHASFESHMKDRKEWGSVALPLTCQFIPAFASLVISTTPAPWGWQPLCHTQTQSNPQHSSSPQITWGNCSSRNSLGKALHRNMGSLVIFSICTEDQAPGIQFHGNLSFSQKGNNFA